MLLLFMYQRCSQFFYFKYLYTNIKLFHISFLFAIIFLVLCASSPYLLCFMLSQTTVRAAREPGVRAHRLVTWATVCINLATVHVTRATVHVTRATVLVIFFLQLITTRPQHEMFKKLQSYLQ